MFDGVWSPRGGCLSNTNGYLIFATGADSYPTMTRIARSGYKAKVPWQWKTGSLVRGLKQRSLTSRRNRWWRFRDMRVRRILHRTNKVELTKIHSHRWIQRRGARTLTRTNCCWKEQRWRAVGLRRCRRLEILVANKLPRILRKFFGILMSPSTHFQAFQIHSWMWIKYRRKMRKGCCWMFPCLWQSRRN